jgi:hypothetical protein
VSPTSLYGTNVSPKSVYRSRYDVIRFLPLGTIWTGHVVQNPDCWLGWRVTTPTLILPSYPGDLAISKRTGTSNRIEIQFRTFNHLSRPDFFMKLFETLCLCLAQGNEYLGQIWDRNLIPLMRYWVILNQKWHSILKLVLGLFRVPRSPGLLVKITDVNRWAICRRWPKIAAHFFLSCHFRVEEQKYRLSENILAVYYQICLWNSL